MKMNIFMNKLLKTKDVDYVIASDTDSIYIEMKNVVKHISAGKTQLQIVQMLDQFIEAKIVPYFDKIYLELQEFTGAYDQKMHMKRETIASKGIWKAKKMYILNALNVEGVQYSEPQLKIQGIEAVRSSTPHVCRENIKSAIKLIMSGDEDAFQKYILEFREKFNTLTFEEVASPRSVNGMSKYSDKHFIYKKGTPIQVKGSLIFNNLLDKYNMKNIPRIADGDKIKFAYLKLPNPVHDTVIASSDYIPEEFNLDQYIDRDLQFEKTFVEPLRSITDIIGWSTEKMATLESFFG